MKNNNKILLGLGLGAALLYKTYDDKKNAEYAPEELENKYVLVTGASTGIGKAIAEELANNKFKVLATVRKQEDADTLVKLSDNIIPLMMDVIDHQSILKAKEKVIEILNNQKLYAIVNNAGIAVAGAMEHIAIDDLRKQFEVNLFGLVDTTQIFFDLLDINNAKIINMSSIGGRVANVLLGAYSASKHALEAVSDSLRRELLTTGIDVIVIQPGMINTPIWDKAEEIDIEQYEGTRYEQLSKKIKGIALTEGRQGAEAREVALDVLGILKRKKNKSRYIVSKKVFSEVYLMRLLPDRLLDSLMKKVLIEDGMISKMLTKK